MALSRPTKDSTLTDLTVQNSLTVDQTTLTVDSTNDRVGVGTTTPSAQLDVQDDTTSSANTGGTLRLSADDGSPMNDSHRLGVLEFTGAEDSSGTQVVGARIEALTDAAWTNAENGCALYFYTTDGNASQTNVLKLDSNQKATFSGLIQGTTATLSGLATFNGNATVLSGSASALSKVTLGTDTAKTTIGCPGGTNTFFTGTAAGDLVLRADDNNNKVHLGAGTSGKAAMVVTEVANVGKVGVGTSTPGAQLDIQDTTTSSANTGGHIRLSADDGSPMNDSHRLGVIEFTGAEDTAGTQTVGARIEALTDAAWTNAENGCSLYFYTTDGNASESNALKIDSNKKSTFNGVLDITDTTDSSDDSGDTGALRVEGGASIAKKLYVGTDLAVDGTANLDNTDVDGTFTMDGSTFDVNATGAVTVDGTTLSLDGTDTTNLTMTANSSSAKALSIDAVNSGSGVSSINLGTTSGTAIVIGHTTSETTVSDNLTITGDLTVNGTTTTINSTTLTVDDLNIVLASGAADSSAANGAGITVDGASANFNYSHSGTKWTMNKPLDITGALTASGVLDITDATDSSDASGDTGALRTEGGASIAKKLYVGTDLDVDGTTNLDAVDIDGATQIDATLSVGVDDTGYDVKFFGDAASAYMLWDASDDDLILGGAARMVIPDGQLVLASTAVSSTAAELNKLDGADGNVTAAKLSTLSALSDTEIGYVDGAGTAVVASKALIADASKDVGTIRNLTIDGTFSDGNYTFDTSGNVSGLGTVGCGAITSGGNLAVTGTLTGDTSLTLDSITITTAEIGVLDGVSVGTAAASKALVLDASKDIGTIRNLTIDGTFSDGNYTFDTSGNVTGLGNVTMTGDLTVSGGDFTYSNGQNATFGVATIGGSNTTGRSLTVNAGKGTGTGHSGDIVFQVTKSDGTSGSGTSTANTLITMTGATKTTVFNRDALFDGTAKCQFRDTGLYIHSSGDGILDIISDTTVQITGATKLVSGALNFGPDQNAAIEIVDTATNVIGKTMTLRGGNPAAGTHSDIAGGTLILEGGQGKGTGNGGDIEFKVAKAAGGSAHSPLNSLSTVMKIKQDKSVDIQGQIVVGADDSGHDVKFYGATASAYMLWDESEDDLILGGAAGLIVPAGQLTLGSTAVGATAAELNILDASAAVAATSDQVASNGNVTSNNYKITHTLTLNGALAHGSGITEFTVTNDKVLATSVVMASSNFLDLTSPREVVAGSFLLSGKNKTGSTLADDSTVVINYIIL